MLFYFRLSISAVVMSYLQNPQPMSMPWWHMRFWPVCDLFICYAWIQDFLWWRTTVVELKVKWVSASTVAVWHSSSICIYSIFAVFVCFAVGRMKIVELIMWCYFFVMSRSKICEHDWSNARRVMWINNHCWPAVSMQQHPMAIWFIFSEKNVMPCICSWFYLVRMLY